MIEHTPRPAAYHQGALGLCWPRRHRGRARLAALRGPFMRPEGGGVSSAPSPGRLAKAGAYRCLVLSTQTSSASGFLSAGNAHTGVSWSSRSFVSAREESGKVAQLCVCVSLFLHRRTSPLQTKPKLFACQWISWVLCHFWERWRIKKPIFTTTCDHSLMTCFIFFMCLFRFTRRGLQTHCDLLLSSSLGNVKWWVQAFIHKSGKYDTKNCGSWHIADKADFENV